MALAWEYGEAHLGFFNDVDRYKNFIVRSD